MTWNDILSEEYAKDYYHKLYDFVMDEYKHHTIYPPADKITNALSLTPYESVKCVILGQDPYHNPGQAMGLSFSVPETVPVPPSLKNIYRELENEYGYPAASHGNLTGWARQGVLLLNAILTVREGEPASHRNKGWETFTDAIIQKLNEKNSPIVFLLWGNFAKSKKSLLNNPRHLVLTTSHPSPLSASYGFLGCGHFRKCNEFLQQNGIEPIHWQIP